MLLLGSTGKVMRPSNLNDGVSTVAAITLQKLVVPLKVLNIDDHEFSLLKEIVLFNPGQCHAPIPSGAVPRPPAGFSLEMYSQTVIPGPMFRTTSQAAGSVRSVLV